MSQCSITSQSSDDGAVMSLRPFPLIAARFRTTPLTKVFKLAKTAANRGLLESWPRTAWNAKARSLRMGAAARRST